MIGIRKVNLAWGMTGDREVHKALIVERDVEARMRDGTILRADVYRPTTPAAVPALLQRTCYGKAFSPQIQLALIAAERGYGVVIQDTRGRWSSDGDGYPFVHEMMDGYDSVEWTAQQPWCDGKVGMFGGSYVGYTQLAAAAMQPPWLKAISPQMTFANPYEMAYSGGALHLFTPVSWSLLTIALMAIMRAQCSEAERKDLVQALVSQVDGMSLGRTFDHRSLSDMPLIGRSGLVSIFGDVVAHPVHDGYWQAMACPYDRITVPAFHIGGWYDSCISSTCRDYMGIQSASEGTVHQRLLVGPWVHGGPTAEAGEVDFGVSASAAFVVPQEMLLRWFDYWLKGLPNGILGEPPVQIFIMGANRWRSEDEWPLARARHAPYYLHSGGAANSLHGNGTLSLDRPVQEPVDTFVYDPRNPVPTRGGGLCCWPAAQSPGAFDQREVEARPDVLVYSTPQLEKDIEVTGPVEVHLWASSSAPATDFTAKLVDVGPCGYARNIADGIIRIGSNSGGEHTERLWADRPADHIIDLGPTSNLFKAGHRIRLEISSSNFPRFSRNPNTGGTLGTDTELRPALQSILHDAERPSHILVPIVPSTLPG